MNLSQLEVKLRAKTGNPSLADVPLATNYGFLNDALQEMANKYIFHRGRNIVTFPTIMGQARYTIPSDCLAVLSLWNTTTNFQGKLTKKDEQWLAAQQSSTTSTPTGYVRQKDWIELSPVPDAIYTMRLLYKIDVPQLVAPSDIPVLPSVWHPGIWMRARVLYWDEKGDITKAQWAETFFANWVMDKPDELQEEDQADNVEGVVLPTLTDTPSRVDFDFAD